ncbi:MAG TPA: hypothetical protein VF735_19385 [Pyrinomonadaceae bacterium]
MDVNLIGDPVACLVPDGANGYDLSVGAACAGSNSPLYLTHI